MFNRNAFKKRILFVGIPDMAYIGLDGLLMAGVNIVGVLGPKKNHNMYSDFKNFTLARGLNYIDYDELDEPQLIQTIQELQVDVAVVCSFNYKIPKALLSATKDGFINVHPSLLPKYRGANPIQRCIYNGDKKTGITTMITVLELDAGDICKTEEIEITQNMTDVELATIISQKSPKLLEQTLVDIFENKLVPIKHDESQVSFANKFIKPDGLIDFSRSAKEIECQIRAMYSWPNAYTTYNGKILKVMAGIATEQNCSKAIGEVITTNKKGIEVATANGVLLITEVKPEGKAIMPASAWINGSGIKAGDKLG